MIRTAAEAFPVIIAELAAKYSALSNRYALKRSIQFTFLFTFIEFIVADCLFEIAAVFMLPSPFIIYSHFVVFFLHLVFYPCFNVQTSVIIDLFYNDIDISFKR